MSVIAIIDAMRAAGCDEATILRAVEVSERERADRVRQQSRERQRRKRLKDQEAVTDVTRDERDERDTKEKAPHTPQKENNTPQAPLKGGISPHDISAAVEIYHAECPDLPKVEKITDKRRRALAARLRDCGGLGGWRSICRRAGATPFLHGENDRGWQGNLDFLTREQSVTRLMEGVYDRSGGKQSRLGGSHRRTPASEQRKSAWLSALDELGDGPGGHERSQRSGGDPRSDGGSERLIGPDQPEGRSGPDRTALRVVSAGGFQRER